MANLIQTIGQVLSAAIGWVGEVISSLFGAPATGSTSGVLAPLLPYLAIGMGIAVLGIGVRYVRSFVKLR